MHIKLWHADKWWNNGEVSVIALDSIKSHLGCLEVDVEGIHLWVTITIDPVSVPFPISHSTDADSQPPRMERGFKSAHRDGTQVGNLGWELGISVEAGWLAGESVPASDFIALDKVLLGMICTQLTLVALDKEKKNAPCLVLLKALYTLNKQNKGHL